MNGDYKFFKTNLGDIYLYDTFLIAEFREGVDIHFNNFDEVAQIINMHFGNKPFGFIANRINSYSLNIVDASLFNKTFPNLKAYAVIAYSKMTQKIFEIENHFFAFNRECFNNLENALEWVQNVISRENE